MKKRNLSLVFLLYLFLCQISPLIGNRVELGNECFLKDFPPDLEKKRLGLIVNQTSVIPGGKSLVEALLDKGHKIQALFSPEHGFLGSEEAGIGIEDSSFEGIKIYSLYGKRNKPTADEIRGVEAFVYDLQDVGTRFYTYITTLKNVLELAAEAMIPVYVLDRPNPIGGKIVEGPLLKKEYQSFFGPLPIPLRYGLTCGELAMMMRGEGWVPEKVKLHVVKMKNWRRKDFWKETGLVWIPPSPNMPSASTAAIYPGTGLLEPLQINEGRGTSLPFLQFGAPWLDPEPIIQTLNKEDEFQVELVAVKYIPSSFPGKAADPLYENELCSGIRIQVKEEDKFHSVRFALALIKALNEYYPGKLSSSPPRLRALFGNELLGLYLEGKISFEKLLAQMEEEEKLFKIKRQKYLLYPES